MIKHVLTMPEKVNWYNFHWILDFWLIPLASPLFPAAFNKLDHYFVGVCSVEKYTLVQPHYASTPSNSSIAHTVCQKIFKSIFPG